jgi:hypothetical protein
MIQFTCEIHKCFVALNMVVMVNSGQIDINEQDCMYDRIFFVNL